MTTATYNQLALSWRPDKKNELPFVIFTIALLCIMLIVGLILSSIHVPVKPRTEPVKVPEHIAKFLMEKEKAKPKPKPKVEKPKPKPKPKPVVKKLPPKKAQKPLTKSQKKARKKAEKSGLLALGNELADLMDTSEVSSLVGAKVRSSSPSATQAATHNKSVLSANVSQGSGGVNSGQYTTRVGRTSLSQREVTLVKQSLLSDKALAKAETRKKQRRGSGVRAEEDITIVFDENKSTLYTIYNRARRKNPGLKGKIVLAVTIAPSGKVTQVKVVSSELNDSKLERRLISRIKLFNFGAKPVEKVTVTFPIEFLPS